MQNEPKEWADKLEEVWNRTVAPNKDDIKAFIRSVEDKAREEEAERFANAICEIIVKTDWQNNSLEGVDKLNELADLDKEI